MVALDRPVWAYQCATRSGLFLKEGTKMAEWRGGAFKDPHGTPRHCVAQLSVSRCRRGSCDACSSRLCRAAKRVAVDQEASSGKDRSPPHDAVPPPSKRACLPLSAPTAPLSPPPPCMFDAADPPPPSVATSAVNLVKDCLCTSCASAWLEANRARQGEQAALRAASEADARSRHLLMQIRGL